MTTTEGTIYCAHCGHQHDARPVNDVCEGCGVAFVVDLANPSRSEVLRAVHSKPRQSWMVLGVASVGFLMVSIAVVYLFLHSGGRRDRVSAPLVEQPPSGMMRLVPAEQTEEHLPERRAIAESLTEGPLGQESIQAVINHNIGSIQQCYEKRLSVHPELSGKVTLHWTIGVDGDTHDVGVASSDLPDPAVAQCMIESVKNWRFPAASPQGKVVNYPFVFQSIGL